MRVLFFMHSAARTGSEVALYNFICHAAGKGMEMAVACGSRGELLERLPPGVEVHVYGGRGLARRAYDRARQILGGGDDRAVAALHKRFKPDFWYVNTILQPALVRQAARNDVPCILHTHELEHMAWNLSEQDVRLLVDYPRLVISSSQSALDVLRTLGRERDMEVCYANIDRKMIRTSPEGARRIREGLGVAEGTFVWAMSGTLDPNKNPVRFVEAAAETLRRGLDAHFVWLGGGETGYAHYAKALAERLGVAARVSWLGARSADYYDCLRAADGLVLTSYKESFSLVTVEAALLGKPVVSFNCGGVKEIMRDGMGTVIESWNTSDLVGAMAAVMAGEIDFDPRVGQERVKEFFIDVQGARWEGVMRNLGAQGRRAAR